MTQKSELEQAADDFCRKTYTRHESGLSPYAMIVRDFTAGAQYRTDRILELLRVSPHQHYFENGESLASWIEVLLKGEK